MKSALIGLVLVVVAGLGGLMGLGVKSRAMSATGLVNDRLAPCPDKPNCVCSEAPAGDRAHIAPLAINQGDPDLALSVMHSVLVEGGGQIHTAQPDYLLSTFKSRLFGFVDDVDVRLDRSARQLHMRSASRVGHSDMGANRRRVERLKADFMHKWRDVAAP